MSKLDRWLPFKFRRDENHAGEPEGKGAPWSGTSLMRDMMRDSFFGEPFFKNSFLASNASERWFGDFTPSTFAPTLDVVDEEDAIRVSAELPGLDKDDIKLDIDDGMLMIRGEKKNEHRSRENGVFRTERYYGSFRRSVPLPGDLKTEDVEAKFDNGVLNIRFPKAPHTEQTMKSIPVKD